MPTLVVLLVHLLIYTYEGHYPIFVQLYWIELDGVTKKPEKMRKRQSSDFGIMNTWESRPTFLSRPELRDNATQH